MTITVNAVNDAPVISDIPGQTIVEGSTFSTISLDNYVSDVDNSDVQMTWTYSGNVQLTVSIVNRVATITTPNAGWNGAETITFKATDPGGLWDEDSATFTVTADNAPPVVGDIPNQTVAEGSTFSTIILDNYVTDIDNSDVQMTWTYSGNVQLTVSIVNRIATITIPNADWYGSEMITFRATDLGGLSDDDQAIFTVTADNAPPNTPSSPSPANGSIGVSVNANLNWQGGDPDPGDTVTYDVYFGSSSSPPKKVTNQTTTSYDPGTMSYSTTYYWKITAWDSYHNSTSSALFHFKTAAQSSGGGEEPPEEPQNSQPIADASAGEPYQAFVNTEITFDGSNSYDPDGNITTWVWVFGDNTNGTEITVPHTFSQPGTYTVTLTVTDNDGATNNDTTTCVIIQPNRPPSKPIITGPTTGTKNTLYTYSAVSTDADNDTIQYTFDWGNSVIQPSRFLPNGTSFSVNHSWAAAGRYSVTVIATDNHTASSSEITVYIDAVPANGVGYLLDNDNDGIYDAFYSEETQQTIPMQKKDDSYLIDSDGDGDWDYTYDTINGLTSYQGPPKTYELEIIIITLVIVVLVFAFVFYVLWKRKSKKQD
jgi:hypothetical protein